VTVEHLTCEYLTNPMSVDATQPRLSWQLQQLPDARPGQMQTAYQILVASSLDLLQKNEGDLWNSGKILSSKSIQIPYGGKELQSMQLCWWKVKVWNNYRQESAWSEPAYWGVGLLHDKDWHAQWIGSAPDSALRQYRAYVAANHDKPTFDVEYWQTPPCPPCPLLRKGFQLNKTVNRAVLYVSALGYYEMWINGERVGNQCQAPEWTNYATEVQYQTFDLTASLQQGKNALAAILADGWCVGRLGAIRWMHSFPHRGFYSLDRRLIAQLVLDYEDGSREIVGTDSSWKINPDGYILMADNFLGETIDATKMIANWNMPSFDDASWKNAFVATGEHRHLIAQKNEPIRVHKVLKPVGIRAWHGKYIVDFGQNIAGHCALKIKGKRGQVVTIRHGEWLNNDSSIYTESLGFAKATDTFILSGNDDEFAPTFTYHGFQYAEVSGLETPLTAEMIEARAVSSDPAITGNFECSNGSLNQLFQNILWTQRNNMFSVMTDNPSRDERTGATGDLQIFCQSSIYNMNMAAFYTKWLIDEKDMAKNGQFFSMIPSLRHEGFWEGWIGAPGWAEAGLIVPWRMYENYGDSLALATLYPGMKSHTNAIARENPDLLWKVRHNHNNDWLNANTIANPPDSTYSTTRGGTPNDLFATAFFILSAQLTAQTATFLGKTEDAQYYQKLTRDIKDKFVRTFVHADGTIEGNSQAVYALALYLDLIPEKMRPEAFARLVEGIKEYDGRLSTGFITTPMMMEELARFGRIDIAYQLLESTRFPSWLYPIKHGATTVWERWDAWVPGRGFQSAGMNSFDHVAFGAINEWLFRHVLGIQPDIKHPGYEHFTIHPRPGGSLSWARGSYNSIRGLIATSWKIDNNKFVLQVTIPANSTATIIVPTHLPQKISFPAYKGKKPKLEPAGTETRFDLGSGEHIVVVQLSN
jgi:alpha-L-rhamnosidase